MDEKIEKVIALAGNDHRYQYFTLAVIIFLWINCNFISTVIPLIEREPIVNYNDSKGIFHENVTLTSDICADLDGRDFKVVESFDYSWASEFHIECKSFEIGAIGSFAFAGNAAGGFFFSIINKFLSHKKILIISSFGFCIPVFICTIITSFDYFYVLLVSEIFIGLFGNLLCYSSLVVAQEIVADKKRSLFNAVINVGYALSGIIYTILFYLLQDWRKVFYTLIGASMVTLILIWIFIYDSPRGYMDDNNYDKVMEILEGIASFNGKLDEFRESIKQDEYQEIISVIKGEPILAPSVSTSSRPTIQNIEGEEDKKNENENEFTTSISESKIPDLTTSLVDQSKGINDNENVKPAPKINFCSLFKYPSIRYKFIFLNILWIGTRASFNGVSISAKSFPGNFYVNIIIGFILESVAYCVTGFMIDLKALGRRGTLWILYGIIVVTFFLLAFLDLDTIPNLILNFTARFCAAGIEVIYYTYSIEIYPTPVRSIAFGINATFGNAGSIGSPMLLEFLLTWQFLVLFAVVCAMNAGILICLPETAGKPMVESIPELDEENNIEKKDENEVKKEDNKIKDDNKEEKKEDKEEKIDINNSN